MSAFTLLSNRKQLHFFGSAEKTAALHHEVMICTNLPAIKSEPSKKTDFLQFYIFIYNFTFLDNVIFLIDPSAEVYNANIKIAVKLLFCYSFSFSVTYIHSEKVIPIFGKSCLASEFHCPVDGRQGDSCLVTVPRHPLHVQVHIL